MGLNSEITAAAFFAYTKCPTKSYLILHGERPSELPAAEMRKRISTAYKMRCKQHVESELIGVAPIDFSRLTEKPTHEASALLVDCETTFYVRDRSSALAEKCRLSSPNIHCDVIPIVYSPWDKGDHCSELLMCFGAIAIGQAIERNAPPSGKVVSGENQRIRNVKTTNYLAPTERIIEAIASFCQTEEPPLVLNKHCSECEFQSRCRSLAIERDDLSTLGAMTVKERFKCQEKGISTVTQLSYGYRPRRRKRLKPTAPSRSLHFKHDHKLKALAIKKGCIHVVGSPSLLIDGTPVFLDVEGMPDRDFYYLIGLRCQAQESPAQWSFWANNSAEEYDIWHQCIRTLRGINNPRIVHYGAYETRFLKLMKDRWKLSDNDLEFVHEIIEGSLNLLSVMYGAIYFPTYSNSLKDIARWLGFDWELEQPSGSTAILLRRCWELTGEDEFRRKLIAYNADDCRAAAIVCEALSHVCGSGDASGGMNRETVNVASLEVPFQRTFGKFPSALPEFEKINKAAYWDYQRSKVYVRTNKTIRRSIERTTKPSKAISVEKEVIIEDKPLLCSKCGSQKIWVATRGSRVVFDLKFTRQGVRRWAVRYRYNRYKCGTCKHEMAVHFAKDTKYGPNLRAYIVYLIIEMRLSNQKISEHVDTVFNVAIAPTVAHDIKSQSAERYEPTYQGILDSITGGHLVHADETKGVVYGGGHYVWVFANLTSVAYVYSASREATILDDVLKGFTGVLVSDFYGGYDALSCPQQKCLIHLMRDINDDVLKHPFNEELGFIAKRFGALLRDIVETIDRHGLKRYYLRKHQRPAEQFLDEIRRLECATEAGQALKKRIEKNREKLFTFLDYDDVPWNNNNAEHAVRAFTRLRNVMVTSTPKGTRDYCILLSVQQTLRYRGISFIDFLRSDKVEIFN